MSQDVHLLPKFFLASPLINFTGFLIFFSSFPLSSSPSLPVLVQFCSGLDVSNTQATMGQALYWVLY